ncbi:MAG: hypothetical protein ACWGNV_00915 [Bacteroidales bacterium]
MMRNNNLIIGILTVTAILSSVSCSKTESINTETIVGTYYGTYTRAASLNLAETESTGIDEWPGMAKITELGDRQIAVHCVGENIDTLFMLDYYLQHDSVMVCLTGDDFEQMYGHMLGGGHMDGHMMGDPVENETEWMHHLREEHDPADTHFGGFYPHMGTFTYAIQLEDNTGPYYLMFAGSKNQ